MGRHVIKHWILTRTNFAGIVLDNHFIVVNLEEGVIVGNIILGENIKFWRNFGTAIFVLRVQADSAQLLREG